MVDGVNNVWLGLWARPLVIYYMLDDVIRVSAPQDGRAETTKLFDFPPSDSFLLRLTRFRKARNCSLLLMNYLFQFLVNPLFMIVFNVTGVRTSFPVIIINPNISSLPSQVGLLSISNFTSTSLR